MTGTKKIPNVKGHWLLGLFQEFVQDTLGTLLHVGSQGDVLRFRLLWGINYLVNDPVTIQGVLLDQQDKFIKNRGFWRRQYDIFGQGLITSEGSHWKAHRKMIAPAFHPKKIANYVKTMVLSAEEMTSSWRHGDVRNIHDDMMLITAEIVTKALFNADFKVHGKALQHDVKEIEHQLSLRAKRPHYILDKIPTADNRRYWNALNDLEGHIRNFIVQHKTTNDAEGTLLSMLMAARDENGSPLTEKELRDESVTLLLAGHDSTAITLSWAFYLLSQHPNYWSKLRKEWSVQLGENAPTFDDMFKLPLTRGVIKETLRLYPPAYIIGRETLEDVVVNGYLFPKGKAVCVSAYVMGRNPKYYALPDQFQPERWTPEFEQQLPKYAFIPFGGGPRTCIGEGFAMTEAMTILVMVGRKLTLKYAGSEPAIPLTSITMPPANGMPMKIEYVSEIHNPHSSPVAAVTET